MRGWTYHVLAALLDGPLHGYAALSTVESIAGRQLSTSTLYATLDRLAADGRVEVVREEIVNGRARRYYGLTRSGAAALRAEAARLAETAALVIARPTRPAGPTVRAVTA
jgi:DNA-binding PadR family transcriptional regulator